MRTGIFGLLLVALISGCGSDSAAPTASCVEGLVKPDSIYADNEDGTVTDLQTGLVWAQCSSGKTGDSCAGIAPGRSWQAALEAAQQANSEALLGHSDWRLPNITELVSLTDTACSPALNNNLFPAAGSVIYWSASPDVGNSGRAWAVDFADGDIQSTSKGTTAAMRLVRAGQ